MSTCTLGHSELTNIKSAQLFIIYNDCEIRKLFTNKTFHLKINNYKQFYITDTNLLNKIAIKIHQTLYQVHIRIINTELCEYPILPFAIEVTPYSTNFVEIMDCTCTGQFVFNHYHTMFIIYETHSTNYGMGNTVCGMKNQTCI